MQSILILGRQPELGIAECESLFGADKIRMIQPKVLSLDLDPCLLPFDRLGGCVKFCKFLTKIESTEWAAIESLLKHSAPEHAQKVPSGKMRIGLSAIGLPVSVNQLHKTGITLKKAIQSSGRSVRVIPNTATELTTAQIIHNKLTNDTGWDLLCIREGSSTIIAQTVKVQNITNYTRRDQARPKRDSRVGMLPPKLAQIIINLAAGLLSEQKLQSICDIPADQVKPLPILDQVVLDPFCGSGVILQEALLDGYSVYGADINPRMIEYSDQNLKWLRHEFGVTQPSQLKVADATNSVWNKPFDIIATETNLGRPLLEIPQKEDLHKIISDTNTIIYKFLRNLQPQLTPQARLCIAVPAWQIAPGKFSRLPLIDQIRDLGYNQLSFKQVPSGPLIYYRPGQFVGRELLTLTTRSS